MTLFTAHLFTIFTLILSAASKKLEWRETEFLFSFGDSYSANGFNVSAGASSKATGVTSSNGLNWIEFLGSKYNVTETKVFDLASSGATINSTMVPPKKTTAVPFVDQVALFKEFLAPKPKEAPWDSSNSLFAIWIGLNDIDFSFTKNNFALSGLYEALMVQFMEQLDILHDSGARSFLIMTIPPTERSPMTLEQGPTAVAKMKTLIANFNKQLTTAVTNFQRNHQDLDMVRMFDTQAVFNTLLDNAGALGFVNHTGFCEAYINGTPESTTQIDPCAPVSNYFWLNNLHPLFTVHDILAHAVSSLLSM